MTALPPSPRRQSSSKQSKYQPQIFWSPAYDERIAAMSIAREVGSGPTSGSPLSSGRSAGGPRDAGRPRPALQATSALSSFSEVASHRPISRPRVSGQGGEGLQQGGGRFLSRSPCQRIRHRYDALWCRPVSEEMV